MNNAINFNNLTQLISIIVITILILIVFAKPIMGISKLAIRAIFYSCLLYLSNIVTASFGFGVGLNLLSSIVCGAFGIYGLVLTYLIRILY